MLTKLPLETRRTVLDPHSTVSPCHHDEDHDDDDDNNADVMMITLVKMILMVMRKPFPSWLHLSHTNFGW